MLHEIFDNGFELVVRPNHSSPTVAVQVWVKVGSLDELPHQRGMAHFLEHMLFKGTARRGVGEIAATVEACGGEMNAYTTFDHTVYHLTLAAPHVEVGIDILADAFSNSMLKEEEFQREKEVIIEEILRSLDSPGSRVGRQVFEMAFPDSEAGRPIIGNKESVASFSHDCLMDFYKTWYIANNATLVVVGDVDMDSVLSQVRATFGALPRGPNPKRKESSDFPLFNLGSKRTSDKAPRVAILRGDFEQPRLEITFPAPSLAHFDSAALDLAAFALGSGEMSRLNRRLRDKEGAVNSVGASVYSPLFGGLLEISALLSEGQITQCIRSIAREIKLLQTVEPISDEELERARSNLKAERVFRDETVDGQARSLGYGMLTPYKLLYDEVYSSVIFATPETAVTGALKRWAKPEDAIIVVLVPERSQLTETEILAAFEGGLFDAEKPRHRLIAASGLRRSRPDHLPVQVLELKPGIKLIYRQNVQGQIFSLTAATEGGLRGETSENYGYFNAVAGLLGTASVQTDYTSMLQAVEGKGATFGGFSGKDSVGYHLQCLPEDMETLIGLWRECLESPVFPEEQWDTLKREIEQAIISQEDSPSNLCLRRFQEQIFSNHPYRYPMIGSVETIRGLSGGHLLESFKRYQSAGPWVIAATGPQPIQVVRDAIEQGVKTFDPNDAKRKFVSDLLIGAPKTVSISIPKDREQTHIVYGFKGLSWDDPDRPILDVLVNILGGHGGRLFRSLRDRESLAYSLSPIISYGCHPGAVGSYIACSPGKSQRALKMLKNEMLGMKEALPSDEELVRAKNHLVGIHDMGLQRSDSQTSTMALMELYGCHFDDFERYPKRVMKVSGTDVVRVAQRLFLSDLAVDVTVGPE